jgi:hypothetical protein
LVANDKISSSVDGTKINLGVTNVALEATWKNKNAQA